MFFALITSKAPSNFGSRASFHCPMLLRQLTYQAVLDRTGRPRAPPRDNHFQFLPTSVFISRNASGQ
ncbi:hypothetical protein MPLA_940005 [Mesorhizobium sp. ORS 3359]|nr:hypothetical protein MPLA_940005 [Mesorhizobium sp. ORS 3359]